MKKIISVFVVAVLCATMVFAIDLSVGGTIDYTYAWETTNSKKDSDNYTKTTSAANLLGIKAFFDAQYFLTTLGFDFKVGDITNKWSTAVGGISNSGSNSLTKRTLSFINLGLYGKYPFDLGIAKIYPIVGFDFRFNISNKFDGDPVAVKIDDINRYYFSFGVGSDIYVAGKLFIRPIALFGVNMNKMSGLKDRKDMASNVGRKYSEDEFKFNIGIGLGYKF